MIYHIAQKQDWKEAIDAGIYVCASLELQGFIHCSSATQVGRTANTFFQCRMDLKLLEIDESELEFELKYEVGTDVNEDFPHIYGPINLEAVTRVVDFLPDANGAFHFPDSWWQLRFWQNKDLDQLSQDEWESLCDGCARCCLYKIQDIDTDELFYTNIACRFLQEKTCQCSDYIHRHEIMPTCIILTPQNLEEINWMPETCAYRLLKEKRSLRWWHPLNSGNPKTVFDAGISIQDWYLPEERADMDRLEDYVIESLDD